MTRPQHKCHIPSDPRSSPHLAEHKRQASINPLQGPDSYPLKSTTHRPCATATYRLGTPGRSALTICGVASSRCEFIEFVSSPTLKIEGWDILTCFGIWHVSFRLGWRGVIGGRVIGGMKLGFSATPQVSGRARDEPRECGLWIVDCGLWIVQVDFTRLRR